MPDMSRGGRGKRRGQGGGRPAKLYSRPPRERTVSIPPRDYAGTARKKGLAASVPARRRAVVAALHERGYEPYEDDSGVIRLRNCPFHQLAQQNRGVVCTMNLSLLEGLLAGLDANDFSPSLEIEPGRCCVVLRPRAQKQPPP
jgi:predicted ArsR family transcriptional regulator